MAKKAWILYDSRACGSSGTDNATVLVFCENEKEAKSYKGQYGAMACYSYEYAEGDKLINEKWEWDYQEKEKL